MPGDGLTPCRNDKAAMAQAGGSGDCVDASPEEMSVLNGRSSWPIMLNMMIMIIVIVTIIIIIVFTIHHQ